MEKRQVVSDKRKTFNDRKKETAVEIHPALSPEHQLELEKLAIDLFVSQELEKLKRSHQAFSGSLE